jgi:thiol-disulfide isomerase/thioredoxin
VVVVNFWATWCIPCEAEFPAIVALHREYAHSGLVVITVSADMLRDRHTKVDPFLASQHAYFANFLQHSADPEDFINAFDRNWQGDLPRTFVYDRHGTLCAELANGQTLKSLETAVRPLL